MAAFAELMAVMESSAEKTRHSNEKYETSNLYFKIG